MADYSHRKDLAIGVVIANLAARGWAASGLGAGLGFFVADLLAIATDDDFMLTNVGYIASSALYMLLPGAVLVAAVTAVRHFFFPRIVWGNAHWIFPLLVAVVAAAVAIFIGLDAG